jgi:RNA polymerase sigma-70 factor (ECF subfamily)
MATQEQLADLLARCALNDHGAFERLYQHTSAQLFGLVLRIVREEQLARDVLQDGYVKVWDRAGDFRPERASATTWMGSIMRNRAIDLLRRRRSSPLVAVEQEEIGWFQDESVVAPELEVASGQSREALRACLEQLTESQRQAIALAYYRGLTHEELARHMDTPLGTVKSWLRRGLLRLKACLESG